MMNQDTAVIVANAVAAITGVGIAYCFTIIVRNTKVARFRDKLLADMRQASLNDLRHGATDYEWRYEMYDSATYHAMLYKFWRPLRSFYDDYSFTVSRFPLPDEDEDEDDGDSPNDLVVH